MRTRSAIHLILPSDETSAEQRLSTEPQIDPRGRAPGGHFPPMHRRLAALDRVTLGYTVVASVVLVAHFLGWRDAHPTAWEAGWLLAAHSLVIALILLAATERRRTSLPTRFLAEWYPIIVMGALYASVGLLNGGAGGGYAVYDPLVERWELAIFGRQIAYEWIRAMPSPAFSSVLHLAYLCYFPVVIASPLMLWQLGRNGSAREAIFGLSLVFFVCYALFLLFPVAGPLHIWPRPDGAATTVWPARTVEAVLVWGDAWGSAFPSSHVAASIVATWFAFKGSRTLGWLLLVPTVGIFFAVVYCQIHYGVDALAGLALGLVVGSATPYLRARRPYPSLTDGSRAAGVGEGSSRPVIASIASIFTSNLSRHHASSPACPLPRRRRERLPGV